MIYSFYYVHSVLPACVPAGQKRAPDLTIDGCEPPCGCWELNSQLLEEQSVLSTSEPSLQPQKSVYVFKIYFYLWGQMSHVYKCLRRPAMGIGLLKLELQVSDVGTWYWTQFPWNNRYTLLTTVISSAQESVFLISSPSSLRTIIQFRLSNLSSR